MIATDPRHGTEAGFEQHTRDNEDPCADCRNADLIAGRRRQKRRTMGHQFTREVGEEIHANLVNLRESGARLEDIAQWTGIADSQVYRIIANGPTQRVYARTWLALDNMEVRPMVTPKGAQRRLQALAWKGWSPAAIAARCGVHKDTITDIRNKGISSTAATRAAIGAVYGELSMKTPPATTATQRRAVGLVRAIARRNRWSPPAAWDNIDDANERAHGNRFTSRAKTDIDPVAVDRAIAGGRVRLTRAERFEVVGRMQAAGWSLQRIEDQTGITRADRYVSREAS